MRVFCICTALFFWGCGDEEYVTTKTVSQGEIPQLPVAHARAEVVPLAEVVSSNDDMVLTQKSVPVASLVKIQTPSAVAMPIMEVISDSEETGIVPPLTTYITKRSSMPTDVVQTAVPMRTSEQSLRTAHLQAPSFSSSGDDFSSTPTDVVQTAVPLKTSEQSVRTAHVQAPSVSSSADDISTQVVSRREPTSLVEFPQATQRVRDRVYEWVDPGKRLPLTGMTAEELSRIFNPILKYDAYFWKGIETYLLDDSTSGFSALLVLWARRLSDEDRMQKITVPLVHALLTPRSKGLPNELPDQLVEPETDEEFVSFWINGGGSLKTIDNLEAVMTTVVTEELSLNKETICRHVSQPCANSEDPQAIAQILAQAMRVDIQAINSTQKYEMSPTELKLIREGIYMNDLKSALPMAGLSPEQVQTKLILALEKILPRDAYLWKQWVDAAPACTLLASLVEEEELHNIATKVANLILVNDEESKTFLNQWSKKNLTRSRLTHKQLISGWINGAKLSPKAFVKTPKKIIREIVTSEIGSNGALCGLEMAPRDVLTCEENALSDSHSIDAIVDSFVKRYNSAIKKMQSKSHVSEEVVRYSDGMVDID